MQSWSRGSLRGVYKILTSYSPTAFWVCGLRPLGIVAVGCVAPCRGDVVRVDASVGLYGVHLLRLDDLVPQCRARPLWLESPLEAYRGVEDEYDSS